jgi:peptidoglycan/xylan/chitin deacetylase (PgdA/CDA1 family)
MGGRVDPALDIMQWLIDHRVPATIFMTGAMADNPNTEAGRDVLRLIDDHRDLFDLGNHSYSHPDFRELDAAGMADQLSRTEASIARHTSVAPRPFFRPPFGGQNASVVSGVAAAGYTYSIMWDIDTIDWRPESDGGPTAASMTAKVLNNAQGGSIVLMHLGGYNTYEALPAIVQGLRDRGLGFATLGGMLGVAQ